MLPAFVILFSIVMSLFCYSFISVKEKNNLTSSFSKSINNWPAMRFIFLFFISYFLLLIPAKAQDSSHIRISLLTCAPGDNELYEVFGHSGLRVIDSSSVTDYVYSYGNFNFADKNFYLKFIRGKLLYFVDADNFEDFKDQYQSDNRNITEQVLNLSAAEKIKIEEALIENSKEENKYYKYDFFLNNCTTRLRDIIQDNKHPHPVFKYVMPAGTTFRQAIHQYLNNGNKYWGELGIDIFLGQPTDAVMTIPQSEFLPDNLMKSLDSSNNNHQLVSNKSNLFSVKNNENGSSLFTPFKVFTLLFLIILLLSFSKNKFALLFLKGFDGFYFLMTGLLGILLIFMWTATDHAMCKNNFNLLWAWPTNVIVAFFTNSNKVWVKSYFIISAAALAIVLAVWFFLPQLMNNALIPLVLILIVRSVSTYLKN
jgi:hypothetical protein